MVRQGASGRSTTPPIQPTRRITQVKTCKGSKGGGQVLRAHHRRHAENAIGHPAERVAIGPRLARQFSTMMGWPSWREATLQTTRIWMSIAPPGVQGTITRSDLSGKRDRASAKAGKARPANSVAPNACGASSNFKEGCGFLPLGCNQSLRNCEGAFVHPLSRAVAARGCVASHRTQEPPAAGAMGPKPRLFTNHAGTL